MSDEQGEVVEGCGFADARLVLALQPVRFAGQDDVAFTEGLARLRLPNGTLLTPDRFLPPLEVAGAIARLDRLVLRRIAQVMMREPHARYSVNISGRTIGDRLWLASLRSLAATRPDIADRLIVEVTESALYDHAAAPAFLAQIRRLGPAVMIDDFGSGYTSILQIRHLPLDGIKLAGDFSRGIDRDAGLQCLVRAMTSIADHYDLLTVAEWVETAAEAACLRRLGIHALQGHFYARAEVPAPPLTRANANPQRY